MASSFFCSQAEFTYTAPREHWDKQKKETLQQEIDATDRTIDRLVYELPCKGMIYGLTEEEIKTVENKT